MFEYNIIYRYSPLRHSIVNLATWCFKMPSTLQLSSESNFSAPTPIHNGNVFLASGLTDGIVGADRQLLCLQLARSLVCGR